MDLFWSNGRIRGGKGIEMLVMLNTALLILVLQPLPKSDSPLETGSLEHFDIGSFASSHALVKKAVYMGHIH